MTKTSRNNNHNQGFSPIEVMIVLAILSTFFLPSVMYIIEFAKGGSRIKDNSIILGLVEERLEKVLAMPFNEIPEGKSSNIILESKNGNRVDLNSFILSNKKISFECFVEVVPVEFSAIKNYSFHHLQKVSLENGMKKITITAFIQNGDKMQNIHLMAYKANM